MVELRSKVILPCLVFRKWEIENVAKSNLPICDRHRGSAGCSRCDGRGREPGMNRLSVRTG